MGEATTCGVSHSPRLEPSQIHTLPSTRLSILLLLTAGGAHQLDKTTATCLATPPALHCRVCSEEDALPTLDEVFAAVPRSCGFDVEIKMTGGPDVERTPPEEVARVVDAIWDVVYRQWGEVAPEDEAGGGGGRDLFFSSFDPGEDRSSSSCCDH